MKIGRYHNDISWYQGEITEFQRQDFQIQELHQMLRPGRFEFSRFMTQVQQKIQGCEEDMLNDQGGRM